MSSDSGRFLSAVMGYGEVDSFANHVGHCNFGGLVERAQGVELDALDVDGRLDHRDFRLLGHVGVDGSRLAEHVQIFKPWGVSAVRKHGTYYMRRYPACQVYGSPALAVASGERCTSRVGRTRGVNDNGAGICRGTRGDC